jgi:hypothetical protein
MKHDFHVGAHGKLFCFASKNLENIRRGVEARRWAVATVSRSAMRGRMTKARRYFEPGSRGLLYCNSTHSFTTPFIVESQADPNAVVTDIWPEPWVLPFSMRPLGGTHKQIIGGVAAARWPFLRDRLPPRGGVSAAMNLTGATVFTPVEITEADWKLITDLLADQPTHRD